MIAESIENHKIFFEIFLKFFFAQGECTKHAGGSWPIFKQLAFQAAECFGSSAAKSVFLLYDREYVQCMSYLRVCDSNQSGDCAAVSTQHVCLNDNYNQALVSPSRHKEETEIHTHRHSLGIIIRNNFSSNIDNQSQRRSATHTAEERCLLPNDEISHLYNVQLAEVMGAIHRKSYRPAK